MKLGGFLTVALLLILAQQGDNSNAYVMQNGQKCLPPGTGESAKVKALNRLKNRNAAPGDDEIDAEVSLPALLAPGRDDTRFDPHQGARITAYVIDVKKGGVESCNCEAEDPLDMDTHIELAVGPDAEPRDRVIVEVTPRWRKLKGDDWKTENLQQSFKGQWVEVTGWLLFDYIHAGQAENTNPGGSGNWRATCWEIHPVTDIKLLKQAPAAAANVQPRMVADFRAAHAGHVQQDARSRESIQKRNEAYLQGLTDKELQEVKKEQEAHRPQP